MDAGIQKALHDKVYDKRKLGALELERLVRDTAAANNQERISSIVDQLCNDYAYAVHNTHARNGGLIGLAAAAIALGMGVAPYLRKIVPPVVACLSDQDARVRYYACESMYNISKTVRGEILPYFNDIFDNMAKLEADTEISVKNGAELLDRLIKDVVSDSASTYVSVLQVPEEAVEDSDSSGRDEPHNQPKAFSLARFIPLLKERIRVLNPHSRMFLVSWITLLDSIPDLELLSHLPSFLGGLFRFLDDANQDVVTSTQHCLERLLDEIKVVARAKREAAALHKAAKGHPSTRPTEPQSEPINGDESEIPAARASDDAPTETLEDRPTSKAAEADSISGSDHSQEEFLLGQDVHVDFYKILEILSDFLGDSSDHVQLTALRWIDSFFEICPENILPFAPELLNQVLPSLSSDIDQVRRAGTRVNASLTDYVLTLPDEGNAGLTGPEGTSKDTAQPEHLQRDSHAATRQEGKVAAKQQDSAGNAVDSGSASPKASSQDAAVTTFSDFHNDKSLDYIASVNALTRQFSNKNETTRAVALNWLIMLQQKAPQKVVAAHDDTFPALLETLADPSDTVVVRDLHLLCQISKNSDESYFISFMVDLLRLLKTDRKLIENRGNLILRQLSTNLSPERIYRTLADCLEREEDVDFASVMVQKLNMNLLTAIELEGLRRKLRNWDSREGQSLFVTLFKSWCTNSIATISLCLLAQAYEQAYNILQMLADVQITKNMLLEADKLIQLIESPVFAYLRMQLVEPSLYPYLYKTLYSILMLLPQTSTFSLLKNRLNCVSAIGYVGVPQPAPSASRANTNPNTPVTTAFDSRGRLKPRDDGTGGLGVVRWADLLERFRLAQEKTNRREGEMTAAEEFSGPGPALIAGAGGKKTLTVTGQDAAGKRGSGSVPKIGGEVAESGSGGRETPTGSSAADKGKETGAAVHKGRFGAAQFKSFASGVRGKNKK